jgi:N-acetyl-1-D-myo-inositol-2-amino-2-deoxy-alpha-D-glucopyranoside deacetylase
MTSRSVVFVHAHPDDESLGTGGTMARYSDEGAHVCLITCTNGEMGEIADVPDLGDPREIRPRLGEVRKAELAEACRRLGGVDLRMLGFRDSGMDGTDANADPNAFINQDLDAPAKMIVAILRELRPQVVATYNEFGFYGHPDHIRAHEAALRAVELAADGSYLPDAGEPHEVAKVYYTAVPRSLLEGGRGLAEQMGVEPDSFFTEEDIARIATSDEIVTTAIDVSRYVDRKMHALEAHRTQLGTTQAFLQIPAEWRAVALGTEHYVLARSRGSRVDGTEADLFEGVE